MKKLRGFSLMEMMVVLLIVSIIAAATAPMVNKKLLNSAADKSPWVWTDATSIAYNMKGDDNTTAVIGGVKSPTGVNEKLYIASDSTPQIALGKKGSANAMKISANDTAIAITTNAVNPSDLSANSVTIGAGASAAARGATVIGSGATSSAQNTIVIGSGQAKENAAGAIVIGNTKPSAAGESSIAFGDGATATGGVSIAIGRKSKANNVFSISIGDGSSASGDYAIAIGEGASAAHLNSVAIGREIETTADNQIMLGDQYSTVYIPGNLVVSGKTYLGINDGGVNSSLWLKTKQGTVIKYGWITDSSDKGLGYGDGNTTGHGLSEGYKDTKWYSDRRLKNVGKAFTGGLEEIKKLEIFNYTFKKDPAKTPMVGVMAQDLQKIFPNAVFKGDDGFLRIRMEDMFYALVNSVKELDNKFDLLAQKQKKIDELEKRIEKLESKLAKLESAKK